MKIRSISLFLIFSLVIASSLVSAFNIPMPQFDVASYVASYEGNGDIDFSNYEGLYDVNTDVHEDGTPMLDDAVPNFMITHDGENKVCVYFEIDDVSVDSSDYVALKIGGNNYALFRDGAIYTLFDNWSIDRPLSLYPFEQMSKEITYSQSDRTVMHFGFPPTLDLVGWDGTFCIGYHAIGISSGGDETFDFYMKAYDENDEIYHWPSSNTAFSIISSNDSWAPTGWCGDNSYCEENEFCMLNVNPSSNECTEISEGGCGYIENHNWIDYECCSNVDCLGDGEVCSVHTCIVNSTNSTNPSVSNTINATNTTEATNSTESAGTNVTNGVKIPTECNGTLNPSVLLSNTSDEISISINNLNNCLGKMIEVREDTCGGAIVCYFNSNSNGGSCNFSTPQNSGMYLYAVCSDLNEDGVYEYEKFGITVHKDETVSSDLSGEVNNQSVNVTGNIINSTSDVGTPTKVSSNKSKDEVKYNNSVLVVKQAINSAKESGIDTLEAEKKLSQAEDAYSSGNYDLAEDLLNEAQSSLPVDDYSKSLISEDNLLFIVGGIVLLIIIAGVYFFIGKKGGKKPIVRESQKQ